MIISRTPFRISFIGGGSDLQSYYMYNGGKVISCSIDKYIYLSAHKNYLGESSLIKYSTTEIVNSINEIKHPIIKNIFSRYDVNSIDFNSTADIPSGTGMGSSSAFAVGLINLVSSLMNSLLDKHQIAELACDIEINDLKEPIGKQDQFAASYGGINLLEFASDGKTKVTPLVLGESRLQKLNICLKLFYTGVSRPASSILSEQNKSMQKVSSRGIIDKMVELVPILNHELLAGDINNLGHILHESWVLKKTLDKNISSKYYDEIYEFAINSGALGGKMLGAGGGGFFLFYIPEDKIYDFNRKFKTLRELKFNFEFSGTQIIYKDEYN